MARGKTNALAFKHPVEFSRNKHTPKTTTHAAALGAIPFFVLALLGKAYPVDLCRSNWPRPDQLGTFKSQQFVIADSQRFGLRRTDHPVSAQTGEILLRLARVARFLSGALLIQAYLVGPAGLHPGHPASPARPLQQASLRAGRNSRPYLEVSRRPSNRPPERPVSVRFPAGREKVTRCRNRASNWGAVSALTMRRPGPELLRARPPAGVAQVVFMTALSAPQPQMSRINTNAATLTAIAAVLPGDSTGW